MTTIVALVGASAAPAVKEHWIPGRVDIQLLQSLDEKLLGSLPLDDPRIKLAYTEYVLEDFDGDLPNPKWFDAAFNDLKRRGDSAIPLLLQVFRENPEKGFRTNIFGRLEFIPNIDREPFLVAARDLWAVEGVKLPPRLCYAMARFFSRYGTREDQRILEAMRLHPNGEVAFVIEPDMTRMAERLKKEATNEQGVQQSSASIVAQPVTDTTSRQSNQVQAPQQQSDKHDWLMWLLVVIAATVGAVWVFLRKSK